MATLCSVCSEGFEGPARNAMVRHIREIHGYSFEDADRMALSAPTASDTHAELAALRDEVRRLREAMSEALVIIDEQAPALTGWRARELAERVRSALRGGDQICAECGMQHAPHANTLCSS